MVILIVDVLIVAALLAGDLISKHFAAKYLLSGDGSYEAIKGVLTFRYSENTGAAFGIFSDSRIFLCVLVGIVVAGILGFMAYHLVKKKYKEKGGVLLHVALSFIVAGGLGNLIDRAMLGYVRDFIDYTIVYTLFKRNFAICNLADVFLTFGVIMLVVYLIIFYAEDTKKRKETAEVLSSDSPAAEGDAKDSGAVDGDEKETSDDLISCDSERGENGSGM